MHSEHNSSQSSHSGPAGQANYNQNKDYFAWARAPGFNPMKAAAVVAGFAVFPPLGAAALLYFLWANRRHHTGSGWSHDPAFATSGDHGTWRGCGRGRHMHRRWTGNRAFDEHQMEVMQNLRTEREAFWSFREDERRKRDAEAYQAFRNSRQPGAQDQAPGQQ